MAWLVCIDDLWMRFIRWRSLGLSPPSLLERRRGGTRWIERGVRPVPTPPLPASGTLRSACQSDWPISLTITARRSCHAYVSCLAWSVFTAPSKPPAYCK